MTGHPLTERAKLAAVKRYILFHLSQHLLPGPVIYPFIKPVSFVGALGHAGIVANIYTGLHDFEEMGFLLHFLRDNDVFADVGANVGSYSLLAAGVCRAQTYAFEPVPGTYQALLLNLRVNGLENFVHSVNCGIGSCQGKLFFTQHRGSMDRVVTGSDTSKAVEVDVQRLDDLLDGSIPTLLKIDVEGYEHEVLKGATKILESSELKAIIIELNGSGERYGVSDEQIHQMLTTKGFGAYSYNPRTRKLTHLAHYNQIEFNTLYLRDVDFIQERLREAKPFSVLGQLI